MICVEGIYENLPTLEVQNQGKDRCFFHMEFHTLKLKNVQSVLTFNTAFTLSSKCSSVQNTF